LQPQLDGGESHLEEMRTSGWGSATAKDRRIIVDARMADKRSRRTELLV
jgi:hypothetical protein